MIEDGQRYTVSAAAQLLHVGEMTLRRWIDDGVVPVERATTDSGRTRIAIPALSLLGLTGGLRGPFGTVTEAAVYHRVHENTVKKWCNNGELPAWRVGDRGVWRIDITGFPVSRSEGGRRRC